MYKYNKRSFLFNEKNCNVTVGKLLKNISFFFIEYIHSKKTSWTEEIIELNRKKKKNVYNLNNKEKKP